MHGIFITGTDTDAGKTVVTLGLCRALRKMGMNAVPAKPVQTGVENGVSPDFDRVLTRLGISVSEADREFLMPFCYRAPVSPHLAWKLENAAPPTVAEIRKRLLKAGESYDFLVVEGAGGVCVPINDAETMRDLMKALGLPVILTVRSVLGCINHALLSLEALRRAEVTCVGVIMCHTSPAETELEKHLRADSRETIEKLGGVPVLEEVPFLKPDGAGIPLWKGVSEKTVSRITFPFSGGVPEGRGGDSPPVEENFEKALDFDREHIFHPYTSMKDPLPVYPVDAAAGAYLHTPDGRKMIDGMASWWAAIHGYSRPELVSAVSRQAAKMAHVMFGGITHAPAVNLARRMLRMLADATKDERAFQNIFFADSGSVSVEVAMKMAFQFQHRRGDTRRTRMLTIRGGYHGDTFGAMSVCDPVTGMHSLFSGILPEHFFAPRPECRFGSAWDENDIRGFREILETHHAEIAAVILEPIVQGAGGMWFYHPQYLREVRKLCDAHGVLLIFDEIATGFGRTGKMFALEHAGVTPDILCLGKALSGGMMTFAATVTRREIAETLGTLMHGPTFMGNPLACAAADASLELLENSPWKENVARIETGLRDGLTPCRKHPGTADVRVLGAIGVVEMKTPVDVTAFQRFCTDRGCWIRPFGKLIYLMPPYIISDGDLKCLCETICAWVKSGKK